MDRLLRNRLTNWESVEKDILQNNLSQTKKEHNKKCGHDCKAMSSFGVKCLCNVAEDYCYQHKVEEDLIKSMEMGMAKTFPKGCPHANNPGEYCYPCMRSEFG
uniref:Uncharacterized protein n=1 Tax=viral metagenome TaxID=1070528 RepID=A0A6C0KQJ8_9ZZZZ